LQTAFTALRIGGRCGSSTGFGWGDACRGKIAGRPPRQSAEAQGTGRLANLHQESQLPKNRHCVRKSKNKGGSEGLPFSICRF